MVPEPELVADRIGRDPKPALQGLEDLVHLLLLLGRNHHHQRWLRRHNSKKHLRSHLDDLHDVLVLHRFRVQHQQHLGDSAQGLREAGQVSAPDQRDANLHAGHLRATAAADQDHRVPRLLPQGAQVPRARHREAGHRYPGAALEGGPPLRELREDRDLGPVHGQELQQALFEAGLADRAGGEILRVRNHLLGRVFRVKVRKTRITTRKFTF